MYKRKDLLSLCQALCWACLQVMISLILRTKSNVNDCYLWFNKGVLGRDSPVQGSIPGEWILNWRLDFYLPLPRSSVYALWGEGVRCDIISGVFMFKYGRIGNSL